MGPHRPFDDQFRFGASKQLFEQGAAAAAFVAMFRSGKHIHLLRSFVRAIHNVVSFTAVMAGAYVFVLLMPELHEAKQSFVEAAFGSLSREGVSISCVAMVGLLRLFGLNRLHARPGRSKNEGDARASLNVDIGGLTTNVPLKFYLLVRNSDSVTAMVLFTMESSDHFLALGHGLLRAHLDTHQRVGRWVLAARSPSSGAVRSTDCS